MLYRKGEFGNEKQLRVDEEKGHYYNEEKQTEE